MGSIDPASGDATIAVSSEPTPPGSAGRSAKPDTALGRYLLIEEIGRGGMGVVFRAYDPKLGREVALKVLRTDVLSAEATARMVREARAMARLNHPNVVAVYDVDLDPPSTGGVVLAMEYVEGTTLRQWQLEHEAAPPPWTEVLGMFVQAGRGLAAAHASGLLHRDFKPANVLVGRDGRVRVTDFGLARAAGDTKSVSGPGTKVGSGSENSSGALTEAGIVMGTPAYMAPEQHRPSNRPLVSPVSSGGAELTFAVDQYAFCLALWESLTGSRPFAQKGRGLIDAKAAGPPSWPREVAVPVAVREAVRKGLAPDPERRWPSMEALLQDLEAGRKPARIGWFLAAGAITAVGLTVAWASGRGRPEPCAGAATHLAGTWDDTRAEAARQAMLETGLPYAEAAWNNARTHLDSYASAWVAMHTETCEATTVRREQSEIVMDLRMACLWRAKLDLAAIAEVLTRADPKVVERGHRIVRGLPRLERCADVEALTAQVPPPDPSLAEAVLEQRVALAQIKALRSAGKYADAAAILDGVEATSASIGYEPLLTEVMLQVGFVRTNQGKYDEAEQALKEAWRRGLARGQWHEAAGAIFDLVYLLGSRLRRPQEAMAFAETAQGLLPHVHGRAEASLRNALGTVWMEQGQYEEAETQIRAAIEVTERIGGFDETEALTARMSLAVVLGYQRRNAEAATQYRAVLGVWRRTLGEQHPDVATIRHNLGLVLGSAGKYEEAEREYLAALGVWEKTLGPDHVNVAQAHNNLAVAYLQTGRYEQAETHLRIAMPIQEKALGSDHPYNAAARANLAMVLRYLGRAQEAEAEYRMALALQEKVLAPDHPDIAASHHNLAGILSAQGKLAEAEHEYRKGLALQHKALEPDHPHVAMSQITLAHILLKRSRPAEAIPLVEQARRSNRYGDVTPKARAEAAFVLADALWRTGGDRAEARRLAQVARDLYQGVGAASEDERAELESWLRAHP